MVRLKSEKPLKRTVKLALTCGEETSGAFNGAEWLAANRRDLIDAEFAMNEGGGGRVRPDGTPELLSMQVGEKHYQDFLIEATNRGGHSSMPRADNAIYPGLFTGLCERTEFAFLGGFVGGLSGFRPCAAVALVASLVSGFADCG
jgi:acetylornithine deacetylase/succinyl-diaminopimelate desuccinylase-like protein